VVIIPNLDRQRLIQKIRNPRFFQMAKEVYDVSQNLTSDQIAMAIFWRDGPGYTPAGHWISILQQVIQQTNSRLDQAVFAYALTGICINDATLSCWITRYNYNLVRPVTYIQNVMGHTSWNSLYLHRRILNILPHILLFR
jgi:hypothetical protein